MTKAEAAVELIDDGTSLSEDIFSEEENTAIENKRKSIIQDPILEEVHDEHESSTHSIALFDQPGPIP